MSESATPAPNALPEHVRFVRGIARSLLFDENEADDAVQDTLLRALEQPPEPGNIQGWLRVVVRNFALRRSGGASTASSRSSPRTTSRRRKRPRPVSRCSAVSSMPFASCPSRTAPRSSIATSTS